MGFYGNITNSSRTSFSFDKVYHNRQEMDDNCITDGVFVGRYVLVDYQRSQDNIDQIDEGQYQINYEIDVKKYGVGRGFDSTVWVKTIDNTYAMIAELNSVVPTFDFSLDPPSENGPKELKPRADSTNVYYNLPFQAPWDLKIEKEIDVNEDGFSPEKVGYDETQKNTIDIEYSSSEKEIYNKYDEDGTFKQGKATGVDTKTIKFLLPQIGNTISNIWDIIYGKGEVVEGSEKKERNMEISWLSAEDAENSEINTGQRLFPKVDFGDSSTYAPDNVNTIAGIVNSVHDLMGMIISENENFDDIENLEDKYIYYKDNKFYRTGIEYIKLTNDELIDAESIDDKSEYTTQKVLIELPELGTGMNTLLGLILKINQFMDFNNKESRNPDTVQGVLNLFKDDLENLKDDFQTSTKSAMTTFETDSNNLIDEIKTELENLKNGVINISFNVIHNNFDEYIEYFQTLKDALGYGNITDDELISIMNSWFSIEQQEGTLDFNVDLAGLENIVLISLISIVFGFPSLENKIIGTADDTANTLTLYGLSKKDTAIVGTTSDKDTDLTLNGLSKKTDKLSEKDDAIIGTKNDAVTALTLNGLSKKIAELEGKIESETALLKKVYPVGAIYISTESTSPKTLFGFGTWSAIGGRFLLGANTTYPAGEMKGAATVALEVEHLPAHSHTVRGVWNTGGAALSAPALEGWSLGSDIRNVSTTSVGGTSDGTTAAHENMPPYLAVYMWKRTT